MSRISLIYVRVIVHIEYQGSKLIYTMQTCFIGVDDVTTENCIGNEIDK